MSATKPVRLNSAGNLEAEARRRFGKQIGWMANVILTSQPKKVTRLKGLIALAAENRVHPLPFSIDYILIDGVAISWEALEPFAKHYGGLRDDPTVPFSIVEEVFSRWSHAIRQGNLEEADRIHQEFREKHGKSLTVSTAYGRPPKQNKY